MMVAWQHGRQHHTTGPGSTRASEILQGIVACHFFSAFSKGKRNNRILLPIKKSVLEPSITIGSQTSEIILLFYFIFVPACSSPSLVTLTSFFNF